MTHAASRPRVAFINRSYWPDVEATGQYLTELCEDLADDFEVHVVCGRPQKTVGASDASYGRSERGGVTIHRLWHTRFDKASFWGRLTNMLSFQAMAIWRAFRIPRPALVVVETDPPFLCLLGALVQRLRGARLVCYLQDIYPDVAVALGKLRKGWSVWALRRLFFAAYRRSAAVIVLSRDMRDLLSASGIPAGKIHVISNWADTDEVFPIKDRNAFRRECGLDAKFVVMYSGNMGMSQGLAQVLDAAGQLRDRDDIVFVFIGDGADRSNLERLAAEKKLGNVRFYDYQPKSRLAESLSAADVHLAILRPEVKQLLMPSKIYGILASGTPAIVLGDADCELADLVARNDVGVVVPSAATDELVRTVREYADDPARRRRQGQNARNLAESHCRRDIGVGQIRALLNNLADRTAEAASPTLAPCVAVSSAE